MIFRFNLEKAILQNSMVSYFLEKRSSCWRHSHPSLFITLNILSISFSVLVYLSQRKSNTFLLHVWRYGDCFWMNPVELCMTLFGLFSGARWLSVIFYAILLSNAACQYFLDLPVCLPLLRQSNWYTPAWLLGSSFALFWWKMLCKF